MPSHILFGRAIRYPCSRVHQRNRWRRVDEKWPRSAFTHSCMVYDGIAPATQVRVVGIGEQLHSHHAHREAVGFDDCGKHPDGELLSEAAGASAQSLAPGG